MFSNEVKIMGDRVQDLFPTDAQREDLQLQPSLDEYEMEKYPDFYPQPDDYAAQRFPEKPTSDKH